MIFEYEAGRSGFSRFFAILWGAIGICLPGLAIFGPPRFAPDNATAIWAAFISLGAAPFLWRRATAYLDQVEITSSALSLLHPHGRVTTLRKEEISAIAINTWLAGVRVSTLSSSILVYQTLDRFDEFAKELTQLRPDLVPHVWQKAWAPPNQRL